MAALPKGYRIGMGTDLHALVKGRKLILGGLSIPYAKGLKGHSDADVVLHAITDALLGAAGEPDIGQLFPDTDARYKGVSSSVLLKKVVARVKKKGFTLNNVDIIIYAEKPKLSPYKDQMKANVAKLLNANAKQVNIKAKTQEGLGPVGEGKAMSVDCVLLLRSSK